MSSREGGERVASVPLVLLVLAGALGTAGAAESVAAQSPESYAAACTTSGGATSVCMDGAVSGRAMLGAIGLASAGGNAVPGSATTLGSRVGGGPRISPFLSIGRSGGSTPASTTDGLGSSVTSVRGGVAVGVFDGLRLMPTVGGFLSVDLIATGSVELLPEGVASSERARTFGAGIRVGILREGFSVPGISVSVAQRYSQEAVQARSPAAASVIVDPKTTSIRATIGKDAGGVEVLAGFGWDGYSGDVSIPGALGSGSYSGAVDGSRTLYFAGASMTFSIVLSLSVEAGWAGGFDPVTGYAGAFDPAAGSAFGSVAARLIL